MNIRISFETSISTSRDKTTLVTEDDNIYRNAESVERRIDKYINTHLKHYYIDNYNFIVIEVKVKLHTDHGLVNLDISDLKLSSIIRNDTNYKIPLEILRELSKDVVIDDVVSCKLDFYMLGNSVQQKIDITQLFDIENVLDNSTEITKFVKHIHQAISIFENITYTLVIKNKGELETYTGKIANDTLVNLIPLNISKHAVSMADLISYMKNNKE